MHTILLHFILLAVRDSAMGFERLVAEAFPNGPVADSCLRFSRPFWTGSRRHWAASVDQVAGPLPVHLHRGSGRDWSSRTRPESFRLLESRMVVTSSCICHNRNRNLNLDRNRNLNPNRNPNRDSNLNRKRDYRIPSLSEKSLSRGNSFFTGAQSK